MQAALWQHIALGLLEYTTIHYGYLFIIFFVTTYALVIKRSANKNDTIKKAH